MTLAPGAWRPGGRRRRRQPISLIFEISQGAGDRYAQSRPPAERLGSLGDKGFFPGDDLAYTCAKQVLCLPCELSSRLRFRVVARGRLQVGVLHASHVPKAPADAVRPRPLACRHCARFDPCPALRYSPPLPCAPFGPDFPPTSHLPPYRTASSNSCTALRASHHTPSSLPAPPPPRTHHTAMPNPPRQPSPLSTPRY